MANFDKVNLYGNKYNVQDSGARAELANKANKDLSNVTGESIRSHLTLETYIDENSTNAQIPSAASVYNSVVYDSTNKAIVIF